MEKTLAVTWSGLVLLWISTSSGLKVETDPFDSMPMGSTANLTMRLSFDKATEEEANWPRDRLAMMTFNTTDEESWAIQILNVTLEFTFDQIRQRRSQSAMIKERQYRCFLDFFTGEKLLHQRDSRRGGYISTITHS